MLKENLQKALSKQLNDEYYSAYLYLAMSAHCNNEGFTGFANWLYVQALEEMAHGNHIYQHLLERGASPKLAEIKAPPEKFGSMLEIFTQALDHEKYVTAQINKIANMSMKEEDHATYGFIQWYVNEQIEEEATAEQLVQKLALMGDNKGLLFYLDGELGKRVFVDPFAN